jgi:aryl-alcohol dehydrogenase-like predicted oxidoreductase
MTQNMQYRQLGRTGLKVSAIGFGSWAIGGPADAGGVPLGWGDTDDEVSIRAVHRGVDRGINFFDTADFYGLGRSETLLGRALKNKWNGCLVATKVGHALGADGSIQKVFAREHIVCSAEESLKRLQKDVIDVYQLHNPALKDIIEGECFEVLETLKTQGKIRFYGASIDTFEPEREGLEILRRNAGDTLQVVYNILNQEAAQEVIPLAQNKDYGIIARMPLQFGLLTGKFNMDTVFPSNDHRSFRLPPERLKNGLVQVAKVDHIVRKYNITMTEFALKFALSHPAVSTIIPGIRTPEQAANDCRAAEGKRLEQEDVERIRSLYRSDFRDYIQAVK